MQKWTPQTIKIVNRGNIPILMNAVVWKDFAIHECLDKFFPKGAKFPHEKMLCVTYIPTGCRILTTKSKIRCQMFVNKVKNLSFHLIKERGKKMPDGFEKDLFKKYFLEFNDG